MTESATSTYTGPERVFSGIQPTGQLHLGNYLGALKRFVALQGQGDRECIYCVVDLHAMTMPYTPAELADNTRAICAAYLASGLDPEKSILFAQSSVPAHAELAWVFATVARMGWLERMTQFKDKSGKDAQRASVGLFTYPVLQAADILAYKATHVPVGEDQKQHLELSRDIADRFNRQFEADQFFPLPEPIIQGPGARIMSLKDGTKKMSKSDPSDLSRVNLNDDTDSIAKKIRKARTDMEPLPSDIAGLEGRPEVDNLVGIFAALCDKTKPEILAEYGGQEFRVFKPALADLVVEKIAPINAQYRALMAAPDHLDNVLGDGGRRADAIARPIMADVRDVVGIKKF